MFDGLGPALQILLHPDTMLIVLLGTTIGLIVAILPGISGVNTMALLLPVTLGMDHYQAMAFLVGIMAAGGFGGSITSILLNVPGDGTNAATTLDGYPMSRKGDAGQAIGASATASALGALFGVVVLILSLPIIRSVILAFGPPEMFALSLAGIALIATVSKGNSAKGLVAGMVGMSLGFIGLNLTLGGTRYTFGTTALYDGIPLIPAVIGLFAIPEVYNLLVTDKPISRTGTTIRGGIWRGVQAVIRRPVLLLRSSFIGTAIGIMPGVGGSVAPWVSYFAAKNSSRHPETFGHGEIEGVIAPEASNDSKDGGALMPLLALGIPGSLTTAILLSAFNLHGVIPGQRIFQNDMPLIWIMILAIVIANVTTSLIGVGASNVLIRLTTIPATIIGPAVLSLALVGGYADVRRFLGIALTLLVGLLGILMVKGGYPRPPLLVGFILLPIVERSFHQSLQIHRGSLVFLLRPITLSVIVLTVLAMIVPIALARLRAQRQRASSRTAVSRAAPVGSRPDDAGPGIAEEEDGDVRAAQIVFPVLALALALVFLIGAFAYDADARLLPLIVLPPLAVLSFHQVMKAVVSRLRSRTSKRVSRREEDEQVHPQWWALLWLILLPALIWLVGTLAAIIVFITAVRVIFPRQALTAKHTRKALAEGLLTAAVTAGGVHLLFVQGLGMRLYSGWLS